MATESKEQLQAIINGARKKLDRIESAESLIQNRALLGKCFTYRNNYSLPKKPSDYWIVYIKIVSADADGVCAFEFQKDRDGVCFVKPSEQRYPRSFREENGYVSIKPIEFARAWQRFLRDLNEIEA